MNIMKMNPSKRFRCICLAIMLVFTAICIAPFLLMLSASLTDEQALISSGYKFWPQKFSFDTYRYLWGKRDIIGHSYLISIFITLVGTMLNVIFTALFAYPLSRKDFKLRNILAFLIFFTMMFNGGMTASYIIWTRVFHIKNTIWALLLPNLLMGGMNVLMVRNYYTASVPDSILEAARIDGASEMRIFWGILLPLSKPVMITVALFAGMAYWNDWSNGLYYITDTKLQSLSVYLNSLMNNIQLLQQSTLTDGANTSGMNLPTVGARMAIAMIAVLPVLVVFPFVQKQLVKGVVMGGVKG